METVRKEYSDYSWTGVCADCKEEGMMKTECLECGLFVCIGCCVSQLKRDADNVARRITICDTCLDDMTVDSMKKDKAVTVIKGGGFWPKGKITKYKAKPPDPLNVLYATIPEGDEFEVTVGDDEFFQILQWIMEETMDEIAGFACWDEETNAITWVYKATAIESSGAHVETNSGDAIVAALTAGFPTPNIQWHTHPGFNAYFSGTDTADQVAAVQRSMQTSPSGSRTFMVISKLTWMLQTIKWEDGEIVSRHEGHARVRDTVLNWSDWNSTLDKNKEGGRVIYPAYSSHGYGGYGGYDTYYAGYGYGDWNNEGLQPKQAPMQLWDKDTGDWIDVLPDDAMMAQDVDDPVTLGGKNGAYVPNEDASDYVFYDNDRELYIGDWSDNDSDYAVLFEAMCIELYDWTFLYYSLCDTFGSNFYRQIINNPDCWGELL